MAIFRLLACKRHQLLHEVVPFRDSLKGGLGRAAFVFWVIAVAMDLNGLPRRIPNPPRTFALLEDFTFGTSLVVPYCLAKWCAKLMTGQVFIAEA